MMAERRDDVAQSGLRRLTPAALAATSIVLIVGAAAIAFAYLGGGPRLSPYRGTSGGPVSVGEQSHHFVLLGTSDETVELVSARAVGADPSLEVHVYLVRLAGGPPIGSSRGPLGSGYHLLVIDGARIRSSPPDVAPYWLDLFVIATEPGEHCVEGIDVTYRAGFLRTRATRLASRVCLSATG
jgi:hypothetical protein